jgi:hypothetical protein
MHCSLCLTSNILTVSSFMYTNNCLCAAQIIYPFWRFLSLWIENFVKDNMYRYLKLTLTGIKIVIIIINSILNYKR